MNRRTHVVMGAIAFFLYTYLLTDPATAIDGTRLYGLAAVLAGALLPDILEPATSANHRGFFHSRGVARGIAVLFGASVLLSYGFPWLPPGPYAFPASCFFLGYLCHLLADSLTPRGLPG